MEKIDETKRRFIKSSLFGSSAILVSQMGQINRFIEQNDNGTFVQPKRSNSPGLFVINHGELIGSKDFPLRPIRAIATDGTLIWFVHPSPLGDARGYITTWEEKADTIESPALIVHRIKMSKPDCPHYLLWRNKNYYMFKPSAALVKRAEWFIEHKSDDEIALIHALSDIRFAALINAVFLNLSDAERIINNIVDLEKDVKRFEQINNEYIKRAKNILNESFEMYNNS